MRDRPRRHASTRTWIPGVALLLALHAGPAGAQRDDRGWLGIYTEPVAELPAIGEEAGGAAALQGALVGLRVTGVYPRSPAALGGLLPGDLIVGLCGRPLRCPADSAQAVLRAVIDGARVGAALPLRIIRDERRQRFVLDGDPAGDALQGRFYRDARGFVDSLTAGCSMELRVEVVRSVLELPIVLGPLPSGRWPAPRSNAEMEDLRRLPESDFAAPLRTLIDSLGLREASDDLLARLARCHSGADPYRLECMVFAHRDPLRLESVAESLCAAGGEPLEEILRRAAGLLAPRAAPLPSLRPLDPPESGGESAGAAGGNRREAREACLREVWAGVDSVFAAAARAHARAFARLSPGEKAFIAAERWKLPEVFAEQIYIHLDADPARFANNDSLIALASRIDMPALLEAARHLARLADPAWAQAAGRALRGAFADSLDRAILAERVTPHGRMLIGGTAGHWHRDAGIAFLLDLGGDDFYTGNPGGGLGPEVPLAVTIDLAGDDAYESTTPGVQGCGCLGVGGLLDLSGNDNHIGLSWCQGTGYFGVGWLEDRSGDDVYRGRSFCQGVGLFGVGLLLDAEGRDRFEADVHAQGVGLPQGIGALIEGGGDDEYYAKGRYATNYGDAGIFDAWSQGCGTGFRTLASGGLGLLLDRGGRDRLEAGNFSQGGGYYYGMGILEARGDEGDLYIGSRYNQGFAAHQAIGVFLERGGDDTYETRQGVAQGLAWDECVTLFRDDRGNDRYAGGQFFSLGASAHNSVCLFLDRAGRDGYRYTPGPGRAGGNDYHGGTSLSVFVDEGGAEDLYTSPEAGNDRVSSWPEHGLFLDLAASLASRGAGAGAPPGR